MAAFGMPTFRASVKTILRGNRGERRRNEQGTIVLSIENAALIEGLTKTSLAEQVKQAALACDAAGLSIGSENPDLDGMFLVAQSPEVKGGGVAVVRLRYEERPDENLQVPQIDYDFSIRQVSVNTGFDPDDDSPTARVPLWVEYTPAVGGTIKQGGYVNQLEIASSVVISLTMYQDPGPLFDKFNGHINSRVWSVRPTTAAYEWFLYGRASSPDAGASWRVTWTAMHKDGGWFEDLCFMANGFPPANPVPTYANGRKLVGVYTPIDFNELNLDRLLVNREGV